MKKAVVGILAHVDAGKTTLAESMLYVAGKLRKQGRVDSGDTLLDTHSLERKRGITIFSSRAVFVAENTEITLVDTPGHIDFSPEAERTLQILDYAVLVISGTDGVQAHTVTLWKLLSLYNIPTFIFVTKMDFERCEKTALMKDLEENFGKGCIDFDSESLGENTENIALQKESVLEEYFESGNVSDESIREMICERRIFPCFFGSGLKNDGVREFIQGLANYTVERCYSENFSARVFKISHDSLGGRLTHMKITGGKLKVRDILKYGGIEEKVNSIRIYSGEKFTACDEVSAGDVCAVTGLTRTVCGTSFGDELSSVKPVLEPIMNYRIVLPEGCDARTFLPKLRILEEEEPQLRITWEESLSEIHIGLMGEVQREILKSLIAERFNIDVEIDSGSVMYKETVRNTVEGVGHYEPLRHYAEVHLLIEPIERGSGVVFNSKCDTDDLDRNWQRLILTHLSEKIHKGVLTGSPVTDVKITLMSGRAHIKHTEGGDFRQATYRAVRQGLMQAESVLLEPYYDFRLEVPNEQTGRAISDIQMKRGTFDISSSSETVSVIKGRMPVVCADGYAAEVASYTGGRGKFSCVFAGYGECGDAERVIEEYNYDAESDLDNTADSVFCTHGSGFNVKWNKVSEYMHLKSCIEKKNDYSSVNRAHRPIHIDEDELEAIMEREFGPIKRPVYSAPKNVKSVLYSQAVKPSFDPAVKVERIIIDGYNVIFAWKKLKHAAEKSLESAREDLINIIVNYASFVKINTVIVFDAYRATGNTGSEFTNGNVTVVYTKEKETADTYIEKLLAGKKKTETVRVVTSDAQIQLSAVHSGVLRMSASEFESEVCSASEKLSAYIKDTNETRSAKIGEYF